MKAEDGTITRNIGDQKEERKRDRSEQHVRGIRMKYNIVS